MYSTHILNVNTLDEWETQRNNQARTTDGHYPCRFPGCQKTYKKDEAWMRRHEMRHDPPPKILAGLLLQSMPNSDQDPVV